MFDVYQQSNFYQLLNYAGTVIGVIDLTLLTAVLVLHLVKQGRG